ncbi:MAG: hypothetical protein HDR24_13980 [Lachnospiraceae bacterium]|nr:hypothetical protein [Lachnospiraceae bacterium]
MTNAAQYFKLARTEEVTGNECAALLLYLSSFCASYNSDVKAYPCGTIAKIRNIQNRISLSDLQLMELVHSYGPLTDAECQKLLSYSIHGCLSGIKTTLSGCVYG